MKPPSIQITPPTGDKVKIHQEELEYVSDNQSNYSESQGGRVETGKKILYKDLVLDSQQRWPLPRQFSARYIGKCPTDGLWGIEHTQSQVERIIDSARKSHRKLTSVDFHVSEEGVKLLPANNNHNPDFGGLFYPIENISYGVQDMIYTRVFAMIIIVDTDDTTAKSPFECLAFGCDTADIVQQVTQSVAESFKRFAAAEDAMLMRRPSIILQSDCASEHSDA